MFTCKSPTSIEHGRPKLNWTEEDHECSPVEQAHKEACDIKSKILHFMQEPPVPTEMPKEGIDLTMIPDALEAALVVAQGTQAWESIPSKIRAEFGNDQARFLKYATNPDNKENLLAMGFNADYLPDRDANLSPDAPASTAEPEPAQPSPPSGEDA